ncbi:hypothetical protein IWX49DRAFT_555617 [Phyllosticta citricarpa]
MAGDQKRLRSLVKCATANGVRISLTGYNYRGNQKLDSRVNGELWIMPTMCTTRTRAISDVGLTSHRRALMAERKAEHSNVMGCLGTFGRVAVKKRIRTRLSKLHIGSGSRRQATAAAADGGTAWKDGWMTATVKKSRNGQERRGGIAVVELEVAEMDRGTVVGRSHSPIGPPAYVANGRRARATGGEDANSRFPLPPLALAPAETAGAKVAGTLKLTITSLAALPACLVWSGLVYYHYPKSQRLNGDQKCGWSHP